MKSNLLIIAILILTLACGLIMFALQSPNNVGETEYDHTEIEALEKKLENVMFNQGLETARTLQLSDREIALTYLRDSNVFPDHRRQDFCWLYRYQQANRGKIVRPIEFPNDSEVDEVLDIKEDWVSFTFSPSGDEIFFNGNRGNVIEYDIAADRFRDLNKEVWNDLVSKLPESSVVGKDQFFGDRPLVVRSEDGKLIAEIERRSFDLIDSKSKEIVDRIVTQKHVEKSRDFDLWFSAALSPDSRYVVSVFKSEFYLWPTNFSEYELVAQREMEFDTDFPYVLALSESGMHVSARKQVIDLVHATRHSIASKGMPIAFSPYGSQVLLERDANFVQLNLQTGKEEFSFDGLLTTKNPQYSPSGHLIGIHDGGTVLQLLNANTGEIEFEISEEENEYVGSDFEFINDETFVTLGSDGIVRIWQIGQPAPVRQFPSGSLSFTASPADLAVSPDHKTLAIASDGFGSRDGVVVTVDLKTGEQMATLEDPLKDSVDLSLRSKIQFADNQTLISYVSNGSIAFWDIDEQQIKARFEVPGDQISCFAFAPKPKLLLAGTTQGKTVLFRGGPPAFTNFLRSNQSPETKLPEQDE
jgi:WD40 repeat protein